MADSIPDTYKAIVYDKPGEISTKIVDLETPKPGPGEVLIRLYGPPLSSPCQPIVLTSSTQTAPTAASATQISES